MKQTANLRVKEISRIDPPGHMRQVLSLTESAAETVCSGRSEIEAILEGRDPRMLVVVGPCSIHDPKGALDYARKLRDLREKVKDRFCVLMRVYFEKPRTTIGWKGLINDPHLDGSCAIEEGLHLARKILLEVNELGLPAATEFLDGVTPQYIADLVSWVAIGARTTESQTHRQMASGLSMPVGFKNGTDGSLQVAMDAMLSSSHPHSFVGIDDVGVTSVIQTAGNPSTHVILRGGRTATNFDRESIASAVAQLQKAGLRSQLMVDCSHANSEKRHDQQEIVWGSLMEQRSEGNRNIMGIMVESYLKAGSQKFPQPREKLEYGVSITDACLAWETTETMLLKGARQIRL